MVQTIPGFMFLTLAFLPLIFSFLPSFFSRALNFQVLPDLSLKLSFIFRPLPLTLTSFRPLVFFFLALDKRPERISA